MYNNPGSINITIGIAAYNAEENIVRLLQSLLVQVGESFQVDSILVYSDCSTDATVLEAQTVKSDIITVLEGKDRLGFAGAVKLLLQSSQSNLTILLNDDIIIKDTLFLEKLACEYAVSKAGLLCANPQPLPSTNFISAAINSTYAAYYRMSLHVNNGNCMHTYDGKVMCLSQVFKDSLIFPDDLRMLGNVDSYIYFACLQQKFEYRFVKNAVVRYISPTTMRDFLRWFIRNNANDPIMRKQFGKIVDKEGAKPRIVFLYYLFIEFLKNPLGTIFIFIMGFYVRYRAAKYANDFQQTWEVVASTKRLSRV